MKYLLYLPLFLFTLSCSSPVSTDYEVTGTTRISFNLPENSHVLIWLENAYHTKMKTLVDQELPSGTHSVQLIMEDDNGNKYPEGIYNYFLRTDDVFLSRTLVYAPNSARP